jgi:hypothetical protein
MFSAVAMSVSGRLALKSFTASSALSRADGRRPILAKLKGARDRKKRETGKCEGRKSVAETSPATVALAKKLFRYHPKGQKRSLRDIAAEFETAGHITSAGTRYGSAAVRRMIAG